MINGKLDMVGNATFIVENTEECLRNFFHSAWQGIFRYARIPMLLLHEGLVNTFAPLVLNSLMMIFYLVVMIRYSPVLTLMGVNLCISESAFFLT